MEFIREIFHEPDILPPANCEERRIIDKFFHFGLTPASVSRCVPDRPNEASAKTKSHREQSPLSVPDTFHRSDLMRRKKTYSDIPPHLQALNRGTRRSRHCLRCGTEFMSEGPGNRICPRCHESYTQKSSRDVPLRIRVS
jgi:hypothetical protein